MAGKVGSLLSRLTGFSTPVVGVSWQPSVAERDVAKELLVRLEDRRVLYVPGEAESPSHCIHSIIEIRHLLSDLLAKTGGDGAVAEHIRALGASARQFMDRSEHGEFSKASPTSGYHDWRSWEFLDALGQLRAQFGFHIAAMAHRYGLPVRGELITILPPSPKVSDL